VPAETADNYENSWSHVDVSKSYIQEWAGVL